MKIKYLITLLGYSSFGFALDEPFSDYEPNYTSHLQIKLQMSGVSGKRQKIFYSLYDNNQKNYVMHNKLFDGSTIEVDNYNIPSNYSFFSRSCAQGGLEKSSNYIFTVMGIKARDISTVALPVHLSIDESICAEAEGNLFTKKYLHTIIQNGGFSLTGNTALLSNSKLSTSWGGGGLSSASQVRDMSSHYWDYENIRPKQRVNYIVDLTIPYDLGGYISTAATKILTLNFSLPGKIN
jgi:hypothetical protein